MNEDRIPRRARRFRTGEVLQRASGEYAIVICDTDHGRHGLLMQLPGGKTFEAQIGDMVAWEIAQLPGPRLVQVRHKGSGEIAWSAYLPDFLSARALWHKLEGQDSQVLAVDIWPQHIDEKMVLDDMGYYVA